MEIIIMSNKRWIKKKIEKVIEIEPNLSNKEIFDIVYGYANLGDLSFKRVKYELTTTQFGMLLRTWRRQNAKE